MNERSTEGEGACWEGVEMTTSPDQFVYDVLQQVHCTCWYTWFSIRVRTEVMGLDPPQSTCTSIGLFLKLFAFERNKCTFIIITLLLLLYLPPRLHNKERENTHTHTHT